MRDTHSVPRAVVGQFRNVIVVSIGADMKKYKRMAGNIFLTLGILVWPVGWWILPLFDLHVKTFPHLLVFHLLGVITGSMLRGSKMIKRSRTLLI